MAFHDAALGATVPRPRGQLCTRPVQPLQPEEGTFARRITDDTGGGSGEQQSTLVLCAALKR